ncbi:hypothetical protein Ferp_0525 [Ferroglobus placidus DSM 10642]|uniref:Uncharacterized protein n=1 Tax=Ferroglobus placidus (strain DSM 10642 / AEDII12DO) TaxID=589924 RepID=D3S366_FERPA|nr:hypothetical protein Ferp_0525 [Ferroglobus placidus DSM 10642]
MSEEGKSMNVENFCNINFGINPKITGFFGSHSYNLWDKLR